VSQTELLSQSQPSQLPPVPMLEGRPDQARYGDAWRGLLTDEELDGYDHSKPAPRESDIVPRQANAFTLDEARDQVAETSDPLIVQELAECCDALKVLGQLPRPCNSCGRRLDGKVRRITVIVHASGGDTDERAVPFCSSCFRNYKVPLDPRTNLTKKQAAIFELLKEGVPRAEISKQLDISEATVSREINRPRAARK